ncbi:MAG TPA: hypothetical protein VLQ79_07320 [Myxococcaceae bacterium]|nr:hypothetical protein [Myxococcaceae bacterium]
MPRGWLVFVVLACRSPVLAQSQPRTEEMVDPNGPGAEHGDTNRVPLPPAGPSRDAFLKEFISVDPAGNTVMIGGRPMSAFAFYNRVDRPDLAARADERTRQRIWLISGSVLVLAAGVTGGAIEFATAQNLNDSSCVVNVNTYNACVDAHNQNRNVGILLIGTSVAVAAGLFTWAMIIPEMVTTPQETLTLATGYNRALSKKFAPPAATLRVFPTFAPGHVGLVARLTF